MDALSKIKGLFSKRKKSVLEKLGKAIKNLLNRFSKEKRFELKKVFSWRRKKKILKSPRKKIRKLFKKETITKIIIIIATTAMLLPLVLPFLA